MVAPEWKELLQINRHIFRRLYYTVGINPSNPVLIKRWEGYFTHNKMKKELPVGNFKNYLLMPPRNGWEGWHLVLIENSKYTQISRLTYFSDPKGQRILNEYYRVADFEEQRKNNMANKACYIISQNENDTVIPNRNSSSTALSAEEGLYTRLNLKGPWDAYAGKRRISSIGGRSLNRRYIDKSGYYVPIFTMAIREKLASFKSERAKQYLNSPEFLEDYNKIIRKLELWQRSLGLGLKYADTAELGDIEIQLKNLISCNNSIKKILAQDFGSIAEIKNRVVYVENNINRNMT